VPGELSLWPQLTGGETLELLGALHGSAEPNFRDELCQRFNFDPSKRNRSYSKGNRQKIALIAALMVRAELLVLDEPTSGLDPLMERTFRECVGEAVANGQTVFLSSHILSEVEALCGRVGILRAGRLVDVGSLAEMRHLRARSVELQIGGPLPDLDRVPGVRHVTVDGDRVRLEVQGSMGPLLDALSGHDIVGFDSREPSLEEIFVAHYDASPESEPLEHT
jgi:ABC-2 type transport system ATP-binding protein